MKPFASSNHFSSIRHFIILKRKSELKTMKKNESVKKSRKENETVEEKSEENEKCEGKH